jgi:hypothetical protein
MAASRIPPSFNPYAVGAVVFDSTPYTNYFLRQEAEAKAKDEALGKYFQDLDKSLTPTGMRTQDIGGFIEKTKGLRQYYFANKDRIKNPSLDNGKAYNEYMGIFKDAQGNFQDVDYLIITPDFLSSQAERLADFHRNNSGLIVRVVTLEKVYQEFSSGKQDIAAIRNLIKYVYWNASMPDKRVKYVNLFGDASYDYKNPFLNSHEGKLKIYYATQQYL